MLTDIRKLKTPLHIPPRLHKDVLTMSYENHFKIRKIYNEIIGENDIHHFSINIVDPNKEMSIISYSPQIIKNIFEDGTYLYNGSISSTYYENLDMYTWDQCYDRRFFNEIKGSLETKNGIETGIVIVHRENGFNILFSFATKRKNNELLDNIIENRLKFVKAGVHCFDQIKEIYSEYYTKDILNISSSNILESNPSSPKLHVIK